MKAVTFTSDEATRILHALRNVHMNLGDIEQHVPPKAQGDCLLLSGEFQGELYAPTTIVEARFTKPARWAWPTTASRATRMATIRTDSRR